MDLLFLGTGAGLPAKTRNVSSVALRLQRERGTEWLFDCGEGTQHQILHAPVKLTKLEKIFITHLHGDHIFGLPGILASRSFHANTAPLQIYGPRGLQDFVQAALQASGAHLTYDIKWTEVRDGTVFEDEQMAVTCTRLDHGIPSFGYRISESARPGHLLTAKLQALGIPPGPVYGRLKGGEAVALENGTVLSPSDFITPPHPGRTVVIFGDTRPCDNARQLAQTADVIVHEATFASDRPDLAEAYFHSTASDAANLAAAANAGTLILTHISARYQPDASALLREAQAIFPNTLLAHDLWNFTVPPK